jgi:hypothetical protein
MIYLKAVPRVLTTYLISAIILGTLWGGPLVILLVIKLQ